MNSVLFPSIYGVIHEAGAKKFQFLSWAENNSNEVNEVNKKHNKISLAFHVSQKSKIVCGTYFTS